MRVGKSRLLLSSEFPLQSTPPHPPPETLTPYKTSRLSAKNAKLVRPILYNYIYTPEEFEHHTGELFRFVEQEKPNIKIHEVYPLQEVARAHTVSAIDVSITYNYMLHCPTTGATPRGQKPLTLPLPRLYPLASHSLSSHGISPDTYPCEPEQNILYT